MTEHRWGTETLSSPRRRVYSIGVWEPCLWKKPHDCLCSGWCDNGSLPDVSSPAYVGGRQLGSVPSSSDLTSRVVFAVTVAE
jgi:hypothetical protein